MRDADWTRGWWCEACKSGDHRPDCTPEKQQAAEAAVAAELAAIAAASRERHERAVQAGDDVPAWGREDLLSDEIGEDGVGRSVAEAAESAFAEAALHARAEAMMIGAPLPERAEIIAHLRAVRTPAGWRIYWWEEP